MTEMHCCCRATLLYFSVTWLHIEAPKEEEVQLARPATWRYCSVLPVGVWSGPLPLCSRFGRRFPSEGLSSSPPRGVESQVLQRSK